MQQGSPPTLYCPKCKASKPREEFRAMTEVAYAGRQPGMPRIRVLRHSEGAGRGCGRWVYEVPETGHQ